METGAMQLLEYSTLGARWYPPAELSLGTAVLYVIVLTPAH